MLEPGRVLSRHVQGFQAAWNAYLCAMYGHLVKGVGSGTAQSAVYWDYYCSRCGQKVQPAGARGGGQQETG